MTIIAILFMVITLILHAYMGYYYAFPPYERPLIITNNISLNFFILIVFSGYILWVIVGFKLWEFPGAIIFLIIYFAWGRWWYSRGKKIGGYEDKFKSDVDKLIEEGIEFQKLGLNQRAEEIFENAIKLIPDDALNWYKISSIYAMKGNKENALKYLSKAINFSDSYLALVYTDDCFKYLWDDKDFEELIKRHQND